MSTRRVKNIVSLHFALRQAQGKRATDVAPALSDPPIGGESKGEKLKARSKFFTSDSVLMSFLFFNPYRYFWMGNT